MTFFKHFTLVFLMSFSCVTLAQDTSNSNIERLNLELTETIIQSELDLKRGDYSNAKINLDKALGIAQKTNDITKQGIIHAKIGKLYLITNDFDKSLASLIEAATIQRKIEDQENLAITYSVQGELNSEKGDYLKALEYLKSAKTIFEEKNLNNFTSEVTLNQGKINLDLKDFKTAKSILENTIFLAGKNNQKDILAKALIYNSQALMELGNKDQSITAALKGLKVSKENNNTKDISAAYHALSNIYKSTNDYEKAHRYLELHTAIADSLLSIKQVNLDTNKQDQSMKNYVSDEMEKLMTKKDKQESLNKITTLLSIVLILILSLLTLSLYKNNNIRLKSNNMLQEKNDDLIEAMKKVELASKTKANFLSTVTHELRTPLYAVTGLTNMLLEEEPSENQIPHLKSLKFSGDYLLTFINDILQINKIEANKVELDPILFNLKTKVENVCSALNNQAVDNNTTIHYDFQSNLPHTFIGDNLKISQILINLIGNSIKFTKNGDIWVKVYSITNNGNDHTVRFEIKDNGIGISKEKQDKMFESFSQGSIQINRKYGGTGLGLSIVKGLIEILKGKIYLKSELGTGTTFFFEIPLTYAPETVTIKRKDYSQSIGKLDISSVKILIVEDNKINQMITKKILNKMNLQCDIVDNGEAAVQKVKDSNYNIVLMDIHMPGISGLEATKRIRLFDKELTIFALTAVTLEDKMHEFDDAGFDDIISKPFKQEDFEKKLYEVLKDNQKSL